LRHQGTVHSLIWNPARVRCNQSGQGWVAVCFLLLAAYMPNATILARAAKIDGGSDSVVACNSRVYDSAEMHQTPGSLVRGLTREVGGWGICYTSGLALVLNNVPKYLSNHNNGNNNMGCQPLLNNSLPTDNRRLLTPDS
jgi:hypothetical protein